MKKFLSAICLFTAGVMLSASLASAMPARAEETLTYGGVNITEHKGGYDYGFAERTLNTYNIDFSASRINAYANEPALALGNRANAKIVDGVLKVEDGKSFIFGSAVCLGDDFGLEEGYLSFDLSLFSGNIHLGVRTSRTVSDHTARGIWFTFDGTDKLLVSEPESGLTAEVKLPSAVNEKQRVTLHDALDTLALYMGDTLVLLIEYSVSGRLAVSDKDGKVLAETDKCRLYQTGYFSIELCETDGYIDNVSFTNVTETWNIPEADALREIDYSTWTATDDLDRTVADNSTAGDPNSARYVGLFYFLCSVGAGQVVQDNTKIYLELGYDKAKEYIEQNGGEAYWAEPYFGYYRNTDTWVYRKHGYMLEQAGVDFIFLDVSNAEVFISGHTALFDTWLSMRKQGINTPQIVFFNGDNPATFQSNMTTLLTTVYSEENYDRYKELFFLWEGKPLVFGNYKGLSGDVKKVVDEKFTVRGSWAWMNEDGYWSWIQEYVFRGEAGAAKLENGGWGRNEDGVKESLSVAMGHHPSSGKGRSFVNGKQPYSNDMAFSAVENAALGLGYASQFSALQYLMNKSVDDDQPFVMMITGWNEWIAGCFRSDKNESMAGTTAKFQYIDQFNCEFSRDGEPMRNVDGYGIGDNFYYQMVDQIRRFKGIAEAPVANGQTTVDIYNVSSFDGIELTYMDSLYDIGHRNSISYDPRYRYINGSGRNDLEYAKVSQDSENLYFLVKASHDIIIDDGSNWMNLYLNTDGDVKTGWEGYDYVLNRDRDSFVVTVDRFKNDSFETETVGCAYYCIDGEYMTVKLSKSLIGAEGTVTDMIFKWADNSVDGGDPMEFMDLGDTAPDNRYGFVYRCESCTDSEIPETLLVANTVNVPQNGVAVPRPKAEFNSNVKETTVDVLYDLSDVTPGVFVGSTPIAEQFELSAGTSQSTVQVLKGESFNYLKMKGYCDLRTWSDVEGSYEFSADIRMIDTGNSAVYIRGEMPGAYTPINPRNFNIEQVFNYFEWDWYAENGGRTYGRSSTAGSGIGIYPSENGVTVRIKRYAEDGLGVASAMHDFPLENGISKDEFFKLRVTDDGELVTVYINGEVVCTVKLESPGVEYATDGTGQQYYGKATMYDAKGAEVLAVENTRLNSEGSQIALTTRDQTMEFANIYIAYKTETIEGGLVQTALKGDSAEVSFTPDTGIIKTYFPDNTPVSSESETDTDISDGEKGKNNTAVIVIAAALSAAAIAIVTVVIVKKTKGKK